MNNFNLRKKFKNTKGITLIALVVTIIILLILAGVSIAMLTGNNGVLSQGKRVKEETRIASVEENVKLYKQGKYIDSATKTTTEDENEMLEDLKKQKLLTEDEIDRENKIITIKRKDGSIAKEIAYGNIDSTLRVEPENIADWEYTEEDDGTITINTYKGSDTTVIIPNYINGKSVKKLESRYKSDGPQHLLSIWSTDICSDKRYYWYPQKTIKEVIISEGIKTIGKNTFMFSEAIEKVTIPNSMKKIDDYAFGNCEELTEVTYLGIKENWNKIEINYGNDQLENAKITYKN